MVGVFPWKYFFYKNFKQIIVNTNLVKMKQGTNIKEEKKKKTSFSILGSQEKLSEIKENFLGKMSVFFSWKTAFKYSVLFLRNSC